LALQHRGGNDDPLLHPTAAHRNEWRRAWKVEKLLNIRHAQAEDHLVPHEAGEHVAVHEDRRVAKHRPTFGAAQCPYGLVERTHQRRRR